MTISMGDPEKWTFTCNAQPSTPRIVDTHRYVGRFRFGPPTHQIWIALTFKPHWFRRLVVWLLLGWKWEDTK